MANSIDTIIKNSRITANTLANSAWGALTDAATIAANFERISWLNHSFEQNAQEAIDDTDAPLLEDVYVQPVNDAEKPDLESIYIPNIPNYPDSITIDTTGLFNQNAPSFSSGGFNEAAPDLDLDGLYDGVEEPNIAVIDAPTISDIDIGDAPELVIPEFDSNFVDPNIADPDDLYTIYKGDYDSALPVMRDFIDNNVSGWITEYAPDYHASLAALEAKISTDMESGRALSDEFETALYNRARSRVEGERARVETEVMQGMSKRGFTLPSSVVSAGLQNSHQSAANNIAQQATELAIERAKLEIQHVQFVMQLSQGITQTLVGASLQYAGILATINSQAIDHSKQAVTFLAETYEQLLKRANLSIDIYRIEAEVYEVELKSALAALDGYKLELDAARLGKEVEALDVDIYSKRIDAENIKINQYVALINAVSEKASLEKLKIDLYGEQVNAYMAETRTKEFELNAYTAALKGDESKLNGEIAKLDAYSKQVDAEGNKSRVEIEHMKGIDSHNRSITELYNSELSKYKTEVQAESSRFSSSIEANKSALAAYMSDNQVKLETYKVNYDKARLDLASSDSKFKADVQISMENAKNFLNSVKIQADTAISAGGVYGSMASSALSSLNTMASLVGKED